MSLENSLVLGRYRVLWPLESKKLTHTYIARDEHRDGLGNPVLVRHYLHDLGDKDSPPAAAMFEELSRLTHLRHPGVVSLLDYGTVGQCLVTAHEHVPGMDLNQLCDVLSKKREPFPPQHREPLVIADCEVDDGDVGPAAIERGEEAQRVDREDGLKTLEPEEDAQRLAGRRVRIDDVHQPVAIEECVMVDFFCQASPPTARAEAASRPCPLG